MNKRLLTLLCLICLLFAACAPSEENQQPARGLVNAANATPAIIPESTPEATPEATPKATPEATPEATPKATPEATPEPTPEPTPVKVDVDLTALSSTMVYAEVYNMMTEPDSYMGKTIKMRGPYYASYFDGTDMYYHYVIIEDATACCAQGLEFLWNGEHVYPDDYPKDQTEIEITGVFGSYEELGFTYYYVAVDDILVLG